MLQVDLNCDMGESSALFPYDREKDLQLLELVSSVNIACGSYAGDPETMETLVSRAIELNVAVGAHPGYADRPNFGRKYLALSGEEVYNMVFRQCGLLTDMLTAKGIHLHHVKPHGALYNAAAEDAELAAIICRAVADLAPGIQFYGLSGSCMEQAADACGLKFIREVFADRSYQDDGSLTPRNLPGALLEDSGRSLKQALEMVLHECVETLSGKKIWIQADSICLHGDGQHAIEFARSIREGLAHNLVTVKAK
jgi:UPF0271 protein